MVVKKQMKDAYGIAKQEVPSFPGLLGVAVESAFKVLIVSLSNKEKKNKLDN